MCFCNCVEDFVGKQSRLFCCQNNDVEIAEHFNMFDYR